MWLIEFAWKTNELRGTPRIVQPMGGGFYIQVFSLIH